MVQKNSNVNLHTERMLKHVAKCLKFMNLGKRWKVLVWQSCLTLCDHMVYSLPCSSVHGILLARILELVAIPSPGDLSDPGIKLRSPALQADSLVSSAKQCLLSAYNCSADCNFYNYPYSCYSCYCLCTVTEQWHPPECPPAPTHFRELSAMGTTNWRRVTQEPFGIDIK